MHNGQSGWLRLAALVCLGSLPAILSFHAGTLAPPIPMATARPSRVPTDEGYGYGVRGSTLDGAAVISTLEITSDERGQAARITIRKGPDYVSNDPNLYGYPGCTLLTALTGGFFEDMDAAQVVICWKDARNQWHAGDNLIAGPTLGRSQAASWEWRADATPLTAACVRMPIGADAVELTALVVYTDVLYVYEDVLPEDGPSVIASWDAQRIAGVWQVRTRDEVGYGATPNMDQANRTRAALAVRELIEDRTAGRYTLQARFNIGKADPHDGHIIEYDSGFDIVPTSPSPVGVAATPASAPTGAQK